MGSWFYETCHQEINIDFIFNQTIIDVDFFSLSLSCLERIYKKYWILINMHSPDIVYAIHNFEAENEDEMTFRYGEPIVILEKDDQYLDGWWQVQYIYL